KTTIYAPMSGTISALNKEQGEIALGSQFQKDVIMVVADLKSMEAQVNVDENDIMSVAVGQPAEIEVDALPNQKLQGVVTEIANGKAVARQATTAIHSNELIEIVDGLKEGDEVVTGSYRAISKDLDNGAEVTINNKKKGSDGPRAAGMPAG